ncbi:glycosyltransferase family 2 protein [Flavobacterium sp. XS2P12]|uniref:glycosyltransferase family 2 protein n=1 Tax=Flavobacterium melibiosi TaxID=3398734 RepID=UPI003A86F390
MNQLPKVSICMITYRHEQFIEEAINSILIQECDFEIELILANDCSPDGTDEVVKKIMETHPRAGVITYIKHEVNQGMMANFLFSLQQCKGEYVALCEGDDYWTDSLKLQKQVGFLDANRDYVLSFHNATIMNSHRNVSGVFNKFLKSDYTPNEILKNWITPTASMVFRNVITEFPLFLKEATHGDLALRVYLCEFGKVGAFNEMMSVYRINEQSITVKLYQDLENIKKLIKQLELMKSYFKGKYDIELQEKIFLLKLDCANCYKGKNIIKQILLFFRTIILNPKLTFSFPKKVWTSIKSIGVSFLVLLKLKK